MTTVYKGYTIPTTADAPSGPQLAQDLVDGIEARRQGHTLVRKVRNTVAGAATTTGGPNGNGTYDVCPPVTIPASPFGAGVEYLVEVTLHARASAGNNGGFEVQAYVDSTAVEVSTIGNGGTSTAILSLQLTGAHHVINPDVTHTARGVIRALSSLTILNDKLAHFVVTLTPAGTF